VVKDNIFRIKEKIASVCSGINRNPLAITIVAVSKGRAVSQIQEAVAAGITDIGENRVQEALAKYSELKNPRTQEPANSRTIKWHLVGHLQTNKAKEAVKTFDLIHSVDSVRLAQEIDKQATKIGKVQGVLIEIKTSPEATKFGFSPDEAIGAIREMAQFKNMSIKGLMTIAPVTDNPENARPYFKKLRELLEILNRQTGKQANRQQILSMGMTDDFLVAVEEGATMIRLGRAIFDA
jgi:pyridoxal phosphate enzyme (YggS family)